MAESQNLIQTITGEGKVFSGEKFIAEVGHLIRVYDHYREQPLLAGGQSRILTHQSIELRINESLPVGIDRLTLHLTDGRKLDFFATGENYEVIGGFY
jgi:hypothetical protein